MKKSILVCAALCSFVWAHAQQKYEIGNPADTLNYGYLKDYRPLKQYVDRDKYPNFRLGLAVDASSYQTNTTVKAISNDYFDETVAGNAMKMASCVSSNGTMSFTNVTNYVNAATSAGLQVYGHTLAWHSQQPVAWLLSLLQDKPADDLTSGDVQVDVTVASKDFRTSQSVGWTSDKTTYAYSLNFSSADGLNIHTTRKCSNFWDVQFQAYTDIVLDKGKTYKMTIQVKGSAAGSLHAKLGDWTSGSTLSVPFTTEWQEVEVTYSNVIGSSFLLLQCGDFVGDIYIRNVSFSIAKWAQYVTEGDSTYLWMPTSTPLTAQEKHDTLVYAMDRWISAMMDACGGKVKAWDVVNEAIAGSGNDGDGNYTLQHSEGYETGTWDVGGSSFYWQDYMGDLEYVRQAVRLARKYGPEDVKLFINDYNLESDWDQNKKVKSLINWIAKWEADGVTHIDGIGTQMHISCYMNEWTQASKKAAITTMFQLMAASGKLVRVSEFDMGMVDASGNSVATADMTEEMHQRMADFYEWIVQQYLTIIPTDQQWGICQWCATDSPANSGWRANTPVGLWTTDYYRKHTYAGFARGLGAVVTGLSSPSGASAPSDASVFDLHGRRLTTPFSQLVPGLYIIGGRRLFVR